MENNKDCYTVLTVKATQVTAIKLEITYVNATENEVVPSISMIIGVGDVFTITHIVDSKIETVSGRVSELYDKYLYLDCSEKFTSKRFIVYYNNIRHINHYAVPLD